MLSNIQYFLLYILMICFVVARKSTKKIKSSLQFSSLRLHRPANDVVTFDFVDLLYVDEGGDGCG